MTKKKLVIFTRIAIIILAEILFDCNILALDLSYESILLKKKYIVI